MQGSRPQTHQGPQLISIAPCLLDLSLPVLPWLADFLRDAPSTFTHTPRTWPGPFFSGPPLLLCPMGITLWPVRQNQMPGKGWGGGDQISFVGQGTLIVLSFPIYRGVSASEGPSLGDILACSVLFFPCNKIAIKQFTRGCRNIRKCFPVAGGATPRAMSPPCLLCWNTLMCMYVAVHTCPLCPGGPTSVVTLVCSMSALPTAPDWLGAGFHRPEEARAGSGLAKPHLSFPLRCWSRAGWGAGLMSLYPLGLESSTANPYPGFENWGLAKQQGQEERKQFRGLYHPPSLYRKGVALKVSLGPAWRGVRGQILVKHRVPVSWCPHLFSLSL